MAQRTNTCHYDTVSEDSLTDLGLDKLFFEAEGVAVHQRGRSSSWPGWGRPKHEKARVVTLEEFQLPELLIYKNDPILADIQGTRFTTRQFMSSADAALIKRILELRLGTTHVNEQVDLGMQQRFDVFDTRREYDLNSDEMPSDVSPDGPNFDEGCPSCGCVGDCWLRGEIHDRATTEASTQTGQCGRCGEDRHEYAECPARNNKCTHCGQKGHFAACCRVRGSRTPWQPYREFKRSS